MEDANQLPHGIPVKTLPTYLDWRSFDIKKKIQIYGCIRICLFLILVAAFATGLIALDFLLGTTIAFCVLISLQLIQIFITSLFIYKISDDDAELLKINSWIIIEFVILFFFIITIIGLICSLPEVTVWIIVFGLKLILLKAWTCFRWVELLIRLEEQPYEVQTNEA